MDDVAVVVIGRNEGERLRRCLASIRGDATLMVYVDSGSTDDSVAMARAMGVEVVDLDMSIAFSAARARNAGFERAIELRPGLKYVQFVDGDCEVIGGWMEQSRRALEENPKLAAVAGRLRERLPDETIYSRLCDMEWHLPAGEADWLGGIAMMRVEAFRAVGGFNANMICGEEPDLCVRLRQKGWKLRRVHDSMAYHDAGMTRFGQWWRRTIRNGHGYAENAVRYRRSPQKLWRRESNSVWAWGLALPLMAVVLAWPTAGLSLLLLLAYPLWAARIGLRRWRDFGDKPPDALLYGSFCMLGKFPQAVGQVLYWRNRLTRRNGGLIEYK